MAASYAPPGMWQDERTVGKTSRALLAANCGVRSTCGQTAVALEPGSILLADRGCDADWIRALAARTGALATSHRDAIAASRFASARICIEPAIWSRGSSTRSSTVARSQRATTSSRPTTSRSFSLRLSGYGCALMSPRPTRTVGVVPVAELQGVMRSSVRFNATAGRPDTRPPPTV